MDKSIFPRPLVRAAAATLLDRCHVLLDLDPQGRVTVALQPLEDQAHDLEAVAGGFGNLLLAELVRRNLDREASTTRRLVLARALDGALPRAGGAQPGVPAAANEEGHDR